MMRLLLTAVLFEVGLVLIVVPWSTFWDRNYFGESLPWLQAIVTNNFVRGAVSGLGVINVLAGVAESIAMIAARRPREPVVSITRAPVEE